MAEEKASPPSPPPAEPPERKEGPLEPAGEATPASRPPSGPGPRPRRERGPRPDLLAVREPLYREAGGFRLRLDIPDLARLRELHGSRGESDQQLGEEFFDGHAARLVAALAGEVTAPAEVRVVVDPFSRQAFLAVENRIKAIVSF